MYMYIICVLCVFINCLGLLLGYAPALWSPVCQSNNNHFPAIQQQQLPHIHFIHIEGTANTTHTHNVRTRL